MLRVKRTSYSPATLLVCTVLALPGNTDEAEKIPSTCALRCRVIPGETKCTLLADPHKLNCSHQDYSDFLRNVSSLDLSDNKLTQVPTWMFAYSKRLTKLSLARNNIKDIEAESFASLGNLKFLNLSFNPLRAWKVNATNELNMLNYLDVTGNKHWLPSRKLLLQLNNIKTVEKLWLSQYCEGCSLVKMAVNVGQRNWCPIYSRYSSPVNWRWDGDIQYGKTLGFIKQGFWPTCLCRLSCYADQYIVHFVAAGSYIVLRGTFLLYVTGSVALLVNIAVVLFIVFNKSLRGDLAVCLILNIAVCDVLIALVALLHASFNQDRSIANFFDNFLQAGISLGQMEDHMSLWRERQTIMGPILTYAVSSQVFGSFILMLEKFLKIVFAMKPDLRLEKKTALLLLLFCWSLSATFALLPVFGTGRLSYTEDYSFTPLPADKVVDRKNKIVVGIAAASQITLQAIQFTSFVLYVPIYIVVKKSGANVGIKREATMARKIALLLLTNIIFFAFPFVGATFQNQIARRVVMNSQTQLVELQWLKFVATVLPVLALCTNSVLNPFLYALRHPRVNQLLLPTLSRCGAVVRGLFVALRERLHLTSNVIHVDHTAAS